MTLKLRDSLKATYLSGMGVTLAPEQVKLVVQYLDLADERLRESTETYEKAISTYKNAHRKLLGAIAYYCMATGGLIAIPALLIFWGAVW